MYIQEDFFVECFSNEVYATLYGKHIRIRYSLEKQQRLKSFSKLAKTYKVKTNSKGKATFKITKLTKKGKFNAVIKFAGNSYYKMVTKTIRITVKK